MTDTLKIYRIVSRMTLCYLLLPLILWSVFWLKPIWSTIFTGLLIGSGVLLWRQMGTIQAEESEGLTFNWKAYLTILAPLLALSLISGIGGLGPQHHDWYKHNAIIYDLSTRQWPVIYSDWNGDFGISRPYLSFYSAYYLPATFISKLFANSVDAANWLLLLWTQLALCLSAFWLMILTCSDKWWLGTIFSLIGSFQSWVSFLFTTLHISQHVLRLSYGEPNTLTLLSLVPHHAIPLWIGTPLLLAHLFRKHWNFPLPTQIFWWTILFAWSPFVALGAISWLLLINRKQNQQESTALRYSTDALFLGVSAFAWLALIAIYFSQRVPIERLPDQFPENSFLPLEYVFFMRNWIKGLASFFFRYGLMVVAIWALPGFLLLKWNAKNKNSLLREEQEPEEFVFKNGNALIITACCTVFLLGLFRVGIANDLYLRGVTVSHLVLLIFSFYLWNHDRSSKYFRTIFLIFLILSTYNSVTDVLQKTEQMKSERRLIYRPASSENFSLANSKLQTDVRRQQYLGLPNSIFARYFLKDNQQK